ncbi:MAG: hypothetical protein LBG97_04165 [Coriobacteriales bacterium]|jgi:hypothetical protein|nr:hypothetical protein [Coriobacteriales bacterium]
MNSNFSGSGMEPVLAIFGIISFLYMVLFYVQVFLGYGTAYRYTKRGGDNGIALFGWLIVFCLAACVPGLGIYLWSKSKNLDSPKN